MTLAQAGRCAVELSDLRAMQEARANGGEPLTWLLPEALQHAYLNDPIVNAVYQMIRAGGRREQQTGELAPDFSREKALIRLVLALVKDRRELLEAFCDRESMRSQPLLVAREGMVVELLESMRKPPP